MHRAFQRQDKYEIFAHWHTSENPCPRIIYTSNNWTFALYMSNPVPIRASELSDLYLSTLAQLILIDSLPRRKSWGRSFPLTYAFQIRRKLSTARRSRFHFLDCPLHSATQRSCLHSNSP